MHIKHAKRGTAIVYNDCGLTYRDIDRRKVLFTPNKGLHWIEIGTIPVRCKYVGKWSSKNLEVFKGILIESCVKDDYTKGVDMMICFSERYKILPKPAGFETLRQNSFRKHGL